MRKPKKDDWVVISDGKGFALVCFKNQTNFYWGQSRSWAVLEEDQKVVEFIGKVPEEKWDEMEINYIKKYYPLNPSENKESAGWLSPDGKFYTCSPEGHRGLAKHLSAHYYNDIDNGERTLEMKGWLKLYLEPLIGYDILAGHKDLEDIITKKQKKFLEKQMTIGSELYNKILSQRYSYLFE